MSDTPISDSTQHNVAELGMLCRRLERELNASNAIIRQQQLLDEENLRLQERIKRLEEELNDNGLVLQKIQHERDGANDRIKRLEEGGGLALGYASKGDFESADEMWNKAKEAKP
jgi:hypothetical protein